MSNLRSILHGRPCRRFGLLAALLAAAAGGCGSHEERAPDKTAEERLDESIVPDDAEKPTFVFPASARSKNEDLNAFLEEFHEICARGEYFRYRDLVSRQIEPIAKEQFVTIWSAVNEVTIHTIRRLPYVKLLDKQGLIARFDDIRDPVYAVLVHVKLKQSPRPEDRDGRYVSLMVFREGGPNGEHWVMSPAPAQVRRALRVEAGVDEMVDTDMQNAKPAPTDEPQNADTAADADTDTATDAATATAGA